jgi:NAD+ kinase
MNIAIYGRKYNTAHRTETKTLIDCLNNHVDKLYVYAPFYTFINDELGIELEFSRCKMFFSADDFDENINYMLSIGGDGTFLEAAKHAFIKNIPIMGINFGCLGFLSQISKDELNSSLSDLFNGNYSIEQRCMLKVSGDFLNERSSTSLYALNEISAQRNTFAMIKTIVKVDGELLSSYWSDGLLVSTPTGSTAYSLSVGGPVVFPCSENIIISPVAPHNLNIRPIVISGESRIEVELHTREYSVNGVDISIDGKMFKVESGARFNIQKSEHKLNLIKLSGNNFFKTLREKLNWSFDPRNQ